MKKIGILTLFIALMFSSCSTTKVERETQMSFRGDWTLDQIVSDQGESVVITNLFHHSSVECFEGSSWNFVANNNKGSYILDGAGCPTNENEFKWFMEEDGADTYFMFKRVDEGVKAKDVVSGYKMKVISVDDSQAHLMHEVPFEGGKMSIHYYFSKQ
ncbi:lipocalin family protein [Weeksellaceae bacterium KMM 9713]|uniref:Lipocalin family protein n=1 Tax=Profundicola chukchiensis TaxID=2961959 RepID=A0A9X4MWK2_9FLAO|nr:lipocalin family protein [Profundicola chukchiensis]MDG4945408.1 lipocalin family protein [Profundicola chukchiensis]